MGKINGNDRGKSVGKQTLIDDRKECKNLLGIIVQQSFPCLKGKKRGARVCLLSASAWSAGGILDFVVVLRMVGPVWRPADWTVNVRQYRHVVLRSGFQAYEVYN